MALGCYQLIIGQTSGFLSTYAVVLTERALFIHEVPTVLGGPVGWAGEFGRNHQDRVLSRRVANIDSTWSIKLLMIIASGPNASCAIWMILYIKAYNFAISAKGVMAH